MVCGCTGKLQIENNRGWYFTPSSVYLVGTVLLSAYVLSGFEKHITLEEVKKYDLPYADGYRGFWDENISIQHPLATVELVAWDSGCTLFISKADELVDKFRREFPLSVDLEMYNKGALDDSDAYEKWLENQNRYFGGEENEI